MTRILVFVYGLVVYVVFLATFLYAIGFVGNVLVPQSVDLGGPVSDPIEALCINAAMLGLFAVQHSGMARQSFKRWLTSFIPPAAERSTFVLTASLLLIVMYWQWRPITSVVWDVSSSTVGTLLQAVFWAGWLILLLSTFLINHFDLFGLLQVTRNLSGKPIEAPNFKAPALYQFVRHPIYLGFLLSFWATPKMTLGHLLFSVATTGYILVGIYFEERDLVRMFGDTYRDYMRQVPMLIPLPGRSYHEGQRSTHASGA